jgi:hypothetical protein
MSIRPFHPANRRLVRTSVAVSCRSYIAIAFFGPRPTCRLLARANYGGQVDQVTPQGKHLAALSRDFLPSLPAPEITANMTAGCESLTNGEMLHV